MVDSAKEAAHRAASDAEQIAWVDEQDNLLGALVRADLRERGLIGRGTYIMLFNSAGELCVHRRTLSKAMYPGIGTWRRAAWCWPTKAMPSRRPASWKKSLAERVELTAHDHFFFEDTATGCGARRFRRCGTAVGPAAGRGA
jgi:isopentenyldiphosphate isomerase